MPKITELYAFVVDDTGPDDEGVIGENIGGQWMPFMGADLERVRSLMEERAQRIADKLGKQIRIYRFSQKEQIGTIEPRGK